MILAGVTRTLHGFTVQFSQAEHSELVSKSRVIKVQFSFEAQIEKTMGPRFGTAGLQQHEHKCSLYLHMLKS